MNKYGGINDMPNCDKRVYGLWFNMLRRCYDTTQHEREKGKSYADCEVCDRWKILSCFANDIKKLEGYNDWMNKTGYCLDKDMKIPGNKVYRKAACMFVPASENIREVSKRHPNITKKANEAYQKTVRELCRRTGVLYYDWCCEYCATPCDKRDGWCFCFEPSHDL